MCPDVWADPYDAPLWPEDDWGSGETWGRPKGTRYYCPECGEVQPAFRSPVKGWRVSDHTRCLPAEGKHDYYYKRCPGGRIDPDKDRAP